MTERGTTRAERPGSLEFLEFIEPSSWMDVVQGTISGPPPPGPPPPGPLPNQTPTEPNLPWWNTSGRTSWTLKFFLFLSVVHGRVFPSGNKFFFFSRWGRGDVRLKEYQRGTARSGV